MCMCEYRYWSRVQKVLDPLELELEVIVRYPMWVLGIEIRSSGRPVRTILPEYSPIHAFLKQSHYVALANLKLTNLHAFAS